ncbi:MULTISPECIES: efflux RND transporter periplasmic adaptor subunit [Chryseobacterium]|uniref:efflux RND transporter periplasmic adaptor subunit n=1 Tax=Chryseobacterium TaxID=59732 RepID=UPI0015549054|nr:MULTISPECIES: efflux RND transporter periplasmic adaptor subunit [unclassified Chryseobacterium]MDC8103805.1 efflux RND transporter periplasmic adaptor subunit [Chryseobacterium sp. B21-037]MDQ1803413.1 efflux RND transporter periplasmic adaptor subunit [Chryseobacterium sp. CKR4-1]WBV57338.1 efflux RND transporter periplasmic adaptor subunit [Chryseobacterium daecheongense]
MTNKLFILSVAAISLTACKKEAPKQDGAKPYPVISVEQKNIVGYQTFPASIQGRVNNDVRAKIQGYITQLLVDEGQYVTKGQPLFRLETNILTENAAAAKAGIGAAESTVAAAQASVNAAQVEVNKLKPLVAKNIISNVQLQTAQANLAQAQAQLQQAVASKRQATANYKGVEANIEYSIIRAPISGVVGKLPLKVGSLVGPTDQTPLTTISDTSEVFAYFSMNEKEYFNFLEKSVGATMPEKIKNLPMVDLQLANGSIYPEKGKIEAITGQIDPTTGTIQFRVAFSNAQKLLSNGNSGTIRLPKAYDSVLVVPESATYEQQGIVYVYKVEKDTAKNVVVNVIDRIDNMALIKSGINKGETIVAAGIGGLKSGTPVKPKPIKMDSLVQSIKPKF